MKIKIPDIAKQIYSEDVLNVLENNYPIIGTLWVKHQMDWSNRIYSMFKDHDKGMIVIYLIRKTLDFYSKNFIKLSYEQYYSKTSVALGKFNTIEISKNLDIPKESARRKLFELENQGVIKRDGENIIIDRSTFPFIKPDDSINRISIFLSVFSEKLVQEKILPNSLTSKGLIKILEKNFTHIWKLFYDMQISMMLGYKKFFIDLETWHIFGTCVVNQHLYTKTSNQIKMNRVEFINSLILNNGMTGINAMSISNITGIPRATVVRKLQKLLKLNFLVINKKKHYKLSGFLVKKIIPLQSIVLNQLTNFSTKVYNLALL